MGPDVTPRPCVDLTDVTLADEDTNSILTDNANRALQGNVAMRVTQPGSQLWNQATQGTSIDAILWPTLELMQVTLIS